jgi:ribosomal protein L10
MGAAEEQAEKGKAAVAALRGSKTAIETVLARNDALERALRQAGSDLRAAKKLVGESAYVYPDGTNKKLAHVQLEEQAQAALKLVS